MEISKLTIPLAIVIGCAILGSVYYVTESKKQASIERQQQIELQKEESERIKEEEKEKKEYIAERKDKCLDIYKTEQDQWNNVEGWNYNELDDICYVIYSETSPKSKEECLDQWSIDGEEPQLVGGDNWMFYTEYQMCLNGKFRNSF